MPHDTSHDTTLPESESYNYAAIHFLISHVLSHLLSDRTHGIYTQQLRAHVGDSCSEPRSEIVATYESVDGVGWCEIWYCAFWCGWDTAQISLAIFTVDLLLNAEMQQSCRDTYVRSRGRERCSI